MPLPQRPREPTRTHYLQWLLTDDGSRTLFDSRVNETFHSGCGAVAESLIVYLFHSGVLGRLRSGKSTAVLEYGLGTATAFLLTAALAESYRTRLTYHALEISLLPLEIIDELNLPDAVDACLCGGHAMTADLDPQFQNDHFVALPQLITAFREKLSPGDCLSGAGLNRIELSQFVELSLFVGDARSYHSQLKGRLEGFDAIYFDPFSPQTNPDLWTLPVFEQAALSLLPGGRLTSYCVKSSVRRLIEAAGLQVKKVAGPVNGKREVLIATKKLGD